MELNLEILGVLCATRTFTINGIKADSDEFGSQGDNSPETAEEYACGDMRFTPGEPDAEVCKKYGITEAEFSEIANKLADGLSFGSCGWCV